MPGSQKSVLICLKVIIQWFIGGWYFACGFSGQRVGWSRSSPRVKMSEDEQFGGLDEDGPKGAGSQGHVNLGSSPECVQVPFWDLHTQRTREHACEHTLRIHVHTRCTG